MALELNGTTGVSLVQDGVVTATDLASTLDLTGKTVTLPAGVGGKVRQCISTSLGSATYTTSSTASEALALGGLSTLASSSSKILVLFSCGINLYGNGSTNNPNGYLLLKRGSTSLFDRSHTYFGNVSGDNTDQENRSSNFMYLDSPGSTTPETYYIYYRATAGRFGLLAAGTTLTLMEIVA